MMDQERELLLQPSKKKTKKNQRSKRTECYSALISKCAWYFIPPLSDRESVERLTTIFLELVIQAKTACPEVFLKLYSLVSYSQRWWVLSINTIACYPLLHMKTFVLIQFLWKWATLKCFMGHKLYELSRYGFSTRGLDFWAIVGCYWHGHKSQYLM